MRPRRRSQTPGHVGVVAASSVVAARMVALAEPSPAVGGARMGLWLLPPHLEGDGELLISDVQTPLVPTWG